MTQPSGWLAQQNLKEKEETQKKPGRMMNTNTHTHTQRKRKIEQKCKLKQENRKKKRGIRQNFQRLNFSGQSAISEAHHLGLKKLLK
jgi:hypothetical protein